MGQEEIFPSRRREKSCFMALAGKESKMTKSRRIIALVLTLTMVFCFMAMSASAATTEIQPRAICPRCGGHAYAYSRTYVDTTG